MALGPALAPRWWSRCYPVVALGLGAMVIGFYFAHRETYNLGSIGHAAREYIGFITLIGSLFVVSGGILVEINAEGTPATNTAFLFAGALAANVLGTTGAAMLLIRPWLRVNRSRAAAHHVAFFIFIVANTGGCLTPIGDPPLFLGFLEGIPFWWMLQHAWPMWIMVNGLLLAMFYAVDTRQARPAAKITTPAGCPPGRSWQFAGGLNLFFLGAVLCAVFVKGPFFQREILMLAAAAGSYFTTPKPVHAANGFNFHPLNEVAILFAGIFATMPPALDWLDWHKSAALKTVSPPGTYFWGTGGLSSVLDNAPTYLGFLEKLRVEILESAGGHGYGIYDEYHKLDGAALAAQYPAQILAISLGAVFFGAATYLGNGPNFMVKAVAEQGGVRPPSFLKFIVKFSGPFLLPALWLAWWCFFRG